MKTPIRMLAVIALYLAACVPSLFAQLTIPGANGSDGALNITTNTVIDLGLAVTTNWDAASPVSGTGVYDSNKWAVVFKYSSVTVVSNATVTFSNHPSHAPVVWLVSGNVTNDGVISLDGQNWQFPPLLAEPGPGGFRGGAGDFLPGVSTGPGFGPGGGQNVGNDRYGGSYGTLGYGGSSTYGNPSLLPLIGGSGGSGDVDGGPNQSGSGGGGGGAILIACAGNVSIGNGARIRANGGTASYGEYTAHAAGGSGGGIRLVCNSLTGNGNVEAAAGGGHHSGGLGRIRIERVLNANSIQVTPDPSVVPLQASDTPLIWLPTNGPTARIVSIGGFSAPADPRASFGTYGPDLTLPQTNSVPVVIETVNAESASVVKVRGTPRANGYFAEVSATLTATNSLNPLTLLWTANLPVNNGYSAVIARVIRP